MRISTRTRHGTVSMGPGALLLVGLFVGPIYLMWLLLVGAVKATAWVVRELAAGRRAQATRGAPDNRLAAPTRHT